MLRIRAGTVFPVTAPPIEDGAVLVDANGRIAAVGPHAQVPTPPGTETREFRDGVLVPGLVKCHTHLELTHLAGQNAEYLLAQLKAFKAQERKSGQSALMWAMAAQLNDKEMDIVSKWLEKQKGGL